MTELQSRAPHGERGPAWAQASFDELGERLADVTFVVVDLETTGGSHKECQITEIGAVKVRGGQVLGEFHSLIDPQQAIPPFIAVLTGITDAMVASAPRLPAVLPAFLEWAAGSVLVAHNAPFDLGFLRAGCEQLKIVWPTFTSIDTARLARRVLHRDEARDCKLATLATLFRASTRPTHRALDDARATVDVMHGLFERLGPLGIQTMEELRTFTGMATASQRRKRGLADGLPDGPGVYIFRDGGGRPLYIGRSRAVRQRVRQYFTASEPRTRMAEMVGIAERVDAIACAHDLEAEVRELRLIAEHKPRYNRRSKFPERVVWLVLTNEPFPRLSLIRRDPSHAEVHLGPFSTTRAAQAAMMAIHDTTQLRQCTLRIPASVRSPLPTCALADMSKCSAPCQGLVTIDTYSPITAATASVIGGDVKPLIAATTRRMMRLAAQQRFEEAGAARDRAAVLASTALRMRRLRSLAAIRQLVAARRDRADRWELLVVRHGRLAACGITPSGAAAKPYLEALIETAVSFEPATPATLGRHGEEMDLIHRWLVGGDARLIAISDPWIHPVEGSGAASEWLARCSETACASARPFEDRRGLRPLARPAR